MTTEHTHAVADGATPLPIARTTVSMATGTTASSTTGATASSAASAAVSATAGTVASSTTVATMPRRSLLQRAGRLAAATLAGLAATVMTPNHAFAQIYSCCGLARPHNPRCPVMCEAASSRGYGLTYWTCNSGLRQMRCYECTKAEVCWEGPFLCSFYTFPNRPDGPPWRPR